MARRPKAAKLAANEPLREYVQERLSGEVRRSDGTATVPGPAAAPWKGRNKPHRQDRKWVSAWSPEQITNRLRIDFPDDESMRISHEAIYQALYIQGRGARRRELTACLRTGRALRTPRASVRGRGKSFVTEQLMISERPAEAEDRAVSGHWEGDLILGANQRAIGTLVERSKEPLFAASLCVWGGVLQRRREPALTAAAASRPRRHSLTQPARAVASRTCWIAEVPGLRRTRGSARRRPFGCKAPAAACLSRADG
jgi:hypothetical protein